MSLVITEGYLIGRYNYLEFDEILIFINKYGNKFTCLAKGIKKIQSKNARALQWGNFLQIELFYSQSLNKISKLKKVTILNSLDFDKSCNLGLITAGDVLCTLKSTNIQAFNFYQEIIIKVLNNYDQYKLSVYVFLAFAKKFLKILKFNKCMHDGKDKKYILDFTTSSMICAECEQNNWPLQEQELLLILEFYKNANNIEEKFFSAQYNINWEGFYLKLRISFNKYFSKINELYYKVKDKNVKL